MTDRSSPGNDAARLAYKILNSEVRYWPYPHVVIPDFLPWHLYEKLIEQWPTNFRDISEVRPVGGYKDRKAIHFKDGETPSPAWADLYAIMHDPLMIKVWQQAFRPWLGMRFHGEVKLNAPPQLPKMIADSLLVEDHPGYSIGPHTDAPQKVCSLLLYMASETFQVGENTIRQVNVPHLGTSVYISDGFTCPGGPHHDRDSHGFREVYRAPYRENTLFALCKTDNSFHGVEPTPVKRKVYIWNLRIA